MGHRAFYGEFGVRADEAGVDRAATVSQAAVALAMILALVCAIVLISDLVLRPLVGKGIRASNSVRRRPVPSPTAMSEEPSDRSMSQPWLAGLILLPAAFATYLLYVNVPGRTADRQTSGGRWLAAIGLGLLVVAACSRHKSRRGSRNQYRRWVALALVTGVFALLAAANEVGRAQARYVKVNGKLASSADAPGSLFSVNAPCVRIEAASQAPVPPTGGRLLLLGSSAGTHVLLETTSTQTLRIPTSGGVLRSCG